MTDEIRAAYDKLAAENAAEQQRRATEALQQSQMEEDAKTEHAKMREVLRAGVEVFKNAGVPLTTLRINPDDCTYLDQKRRLFRKPEPDYAGRKVYSGGHVVEALQYTKQYEISGGGEGYPSETRMTVTWLCDDGQIRAQGSQSRNGDEIVTFYQEGDGSTGPHQYGPTAESVAEMIAELMVQHGIRPPTS